MATLKCKMCGGDLAVEQSVTVTECEYCGTTQTIPNVDDEKKITLFARANRLRFANDFDKAAGVYESIIADFPEEAEAYWGLVLCKYGIEYVDDPATAKKIPTCHRSSFDSVMDDSDFELTLEYADVVARKVYRDEAKQIEEIRKGIIEVSGKEEPYDIFICYKETAENGERTIDSVMAQDVYDALTDKGYRVFFSRISLEDKLGQEYEPYIFAALNSAKIMLVFGTDYEYFNAVWVKNEWSRFLKLMIADKSKHLIPCYKGIDAYDMPKEFAKLQAQDLGKVGATQDLMRGIEKILPRQKESESAQTVSVEQSAPVQVVGGPNAMALVTRGYNAIEDGNFTEAKTHFDKALDIDAGCARAYLGLALAAKGMKTARELILYGKGNNIDSNFTRAKKYADQDLLDELAEYERERDQKREDNQRLIREARELKEIKEHKAKELEEKKEREEQEKRERQLRVPSLKEKRDEISVVQNLISVGNKCTFGVRSDSRVVMAGYCEHDEKNAVDWTNIVAISAGCERIVGLKADGTVVAIGNNEHDQCDVSGWRDITAVSASWWSHTLGLKSDGTVVAVGHNAYGQCNVSDWCNIVAIAAGNLHSVGLKFDGTVVAVGNNDKGQCNVSDWTDIVAISSRGEHTVGLKSDGTVVVAGYNLYKVNEWTDIVAIAAGESHTIGLKSDGTAIAAGYNMLGRYDVGDWSDIVAIAAGEDHTVGLKSDGTVIAVGSDWQGQCRVNDWKLFDSIDVILEKKIAEEKRIAEENRIAQEKRIAEQKAAYRAQGVCQHCGGELKGVFTKKCTKCGKPKDY